MLELGFRHVKGAVQENDNVLDIRFDYGPHYRKYQPVCNLYHEGDDEYGCHPKISSAALLFFVNPRGAICGQAHAYQRP